MKTVEILIKILKYSWMCLAFLFCFSFVQAQNNLKIMSYNIRIAKPPSKGWSDAEIDSTAAVINRYKPALVALQEVDAYTERSGTGMNQARELGRLTDMNFHFAKAVDRSNGDYGVAVLSKMPVEHAHSFRLKTTDSINYEYRACAVAGVNYLGNNILFASVHLDHLNDDVRRGQWEQLKDYLSYYQGLPIIIGGDLNTGAGSELLEIIENDGWTIFPADKSVKTFSTENPRVLLDYFLFSKEAVKLFKTFDFSVISEEKYASDHFPIIMDLVRK